MATYKVIQDIEAEDKFVGPLTLKQFMFAGAALFFGYLNFFAITKGAYFLMIIFTPPMLLGGFLAFPWSKEQSTEVWLLAKIRFRVKPQIRIWDQSGYEELVTITVPKKIEKQLTNGLDQYEVESRLKALAETIDTRGWATKNATAQAATYASPLTQYGTDRLVAADSIAREVPEVDINSYTDVLDDQATESQNMEHLMKESQDRHRQETLQRMEQARQASQRAAQPKTVAASQIAQAQTQAPQAVAAPQVQFTPPIDGPTPQRQAQPNPIDEAALAQQLRFNSQARNTATGHLRKLSTHSPAPAGTATITAAVTTQDSAVTEDAKPQAEMTKQADADIIELARNNDRSIESIAREAKKKDLDDGEVVISLR